MPKLAFGSNRRHRTSPAKPSSLGGAEGEVGYRLGFANGISLEKFIDADPFGYLAKKQVTAHERTSMTISRFDGEVYWDEKRVDSDLYPQLGPRGLRINRWKLSNTTGGLQLEERGPHFYLNIVSAYFLAGISPEDIAIGATFSFKGPSLGTVTSREGYAASDRGSGARPIRSIDLSVTYQNDALQIQFSGEAGEFLRWSVDRGEGSGGTPNFEVKIIIPTKRLQELFYFDGPNVDPWGENLVKRFTERLNQGHQESE